ncbi:hypothetical protein NQL31_003717 [Lotmaria passim]
MASYPYAHAWRSTTPPLYYHEPEGTAPSYYIVPAREVECLRVPARSEAAQSTAATTTAAASAHPRTSVAPHTSTDRGSTQRPPPSPRLSGYAMPAVVNPYASQPAAEPANPPTYASTAVAGRWSTHPYPTADPLTSRVAAIDAEENAMAAEEATLRARLAELQISRKRQDDEQVYLSHGWAEMVEKEERYYTEPPVDLRPDIAAREQHCAVLRARLEQAEAQAQHAEEQLQSTQYILREMESFERERQRVQDGFQDIERRRRECVAKAERYFDVETKRVVEGSKLIRRLDVQLREMTRRGPLAQLQGHRRSPSTHVSSSRAVTFAAEKSIVLDLGREESTEPALIESGGGLSSSCTSTHRSSPAIEALTANEEDIGGTSIAYSLNDAKAPLLPKRRKTEVAMV